MEKEERNIVKRHIDRKLIFRIRIFILIFLTMMGITVYDALQHRIGILLAFGGIILGVIIGFIANRIFSTKWHPEASKVVTHIDELGVIILIVYITFSFFKKWIFSHWLYGPTLTAFTFSLLGGIMLGRLLGTIRNVKNTLIFNGIIR